jgi:uncharacterized protein YndB with AHSA1/START domain
MSETPKIQLEHFYACEPATLWRALTDPELHAKWWAAGDVKPVVGHRFDLDMGQWGKQPCEVLAVEPERLLQYRFAAGSLDTTITWRLSREPGGTRLTLTHEGFDLDSPLGRSALEGMGKGWPGILRHLAKVLGAENPPTAAPSA